MKEDISIAPRNPVAAAGDPRIWELCGRAEALWNIDPGQASCFAEEALALAEQAQDRECLAVALFTLASCRINLSDYEYAAALLERCTGIFGETGEGRIYEQVLNCMGRLCLHTGKYREAFGWYEKALGLAQSHTVRIDAKVGLGGACIALGDHVAATRYMTEARSESVDLGYEAGLMAALNGLSNLYTRTGLYESSIELLLEALDVAERIGDIRNQANIFINVGVLYRKLNDADNSLKYYLLCLEKQKVIGERKSIAICLNNIGSSYFKFGEYGTALDYYRQSLALRRELGDKPGQASSLANIGAVYLELGQLDEAYPAFRESLAIRNATNDRAGGVSAYIHLGKLALRSNDPERTIEYLQHALSIAGELQLQEQRIAAHEMISEAYKILADYKSALEHHEKYSELRQTLYREETERRTKSLMIRFDTERALRDAEIERLRNVELSNANKRLEQLNREKGEFLAVAAHDLKNPLYNMKMLSEILMEPEKLSIDEIREFASDIAGVSNSMFGLVKSLLDVEAIESGKINIRNEEFSATGAVEDVVKRYRLNAEAKDIRLDTAAVSAGMSTCNDPLRFTEIIDNLISNAIKYSPFGKQVTVRLFTTEHGRFRFEVQDEGPGISAEDMEKLFGKFQRLSARPTNGESSTGLGLSIVKMLTEAMNGEIWCESKPGEGTTFILELPLRNG